MKPLERIARKINRMKEDPQDWAEFVTDFLRIQKWQMKLQQPMKKTR